ncbi:MAG: MBL fold metallo-hydrolase [Acidobacteria bacterium]|nr:MBL fold metallo-hydrolase [Acidobacteriota bacterium]
MIVTRFFEPTIAQVSYLIGCAARGEAIVIDPNRDITPYLAAAAEAGVRITHVTETHIHADFASGSRELAQATGARLLLSDEGDADWKYAYAHEGRLIRHGDRVTVGNIHVDVVHTPGHTPEHVAFLITDGAAADRPIAAATGDFIFVGDVGRPDLLEKAAHVVGTMEASARTLWRSLRAFDIHEDWLQIWPGHGAGSACGKGISAVPYSTLGYERRFSWAYGVKSEDEFVARVLDGQPDPPTYFAAMKALNKRGPDLRRTSLPPRLDGERLPALVQAGALVVDTRAAEAFAERHVAGTLSLPAGGSFVTWAGWLLPYDDDLYLIARDADDDTVGELVRQLALIGLDRVAGVFSADAVADAVGGGAPSGRVPQMTPLALAARLAAGDVHVLDVRHDSEWQGGHIAGAVHLPLGHLAERRQDIPTGRPMVVHCKSGTRSAIAISVLRRLGHANVTNMPGGIDAWVSAGLPLAARSSPP